MPVLIYEELFPLQKIKIKNIVDFAPPPPPFFFFFLLCENNAR
jgi:hypothetical protein